jgi:F-box/leucine-rich repeat protein 2/20
MSFFTEKTLKKKKRPPRWSHLWLKNTKPLKHALFAMQLQSVSSPPTPTPTPTLTPQQQQQADPNTKLKDKTGTLISNLPDIDRTLLLGDDLLLKILSKLPL